MASPAPVPGPIFCAEKQRLLAEFTVAATEYLQALSAQLKSAALGNGFGLEAEIHAARQRKDETKYVVLKHQGEHGC